MDLTNRLLISAPHLWDPNFRRTVLLVCSHDEEGAMGLILNHPFDLPATGVVAAWDHLILPPDRVFRGGPVQPETGIGLGRSLAGRAWQLIDLEVPPEMAEPCSGIRIFSGYSGWGPGQLEAELDEAAWIVADARPDDGFSPSPETLWQEVVGRGPGATRLMTTMPDDPRLN